MTNIILILVAAFFAGGCFFTAIQTGRAAKAAHRVAPSFCKLCVFLTIGFVIAGTAFAVLVAILLVNASLVVGL